MPGQVPGHPAEVRRAAHRVVAAATVDVDIDEARGEVGDRCPSRSIAVHLDRDDDAPFDHDPTRHDGVGEDQSPGEDRGVRAHASSSGVTTSGASTSNATTSA